MYLPSPAIDFVAPYCDIVERLEAVPPAARVRDLYFKTVEAELERRGVISTYRELFPVKQRWTMGWHSVKEYLLRLACAGALITSPEQLHDGMRELAHANATNFAKSLIGRAMIRLLSRDPVRLSEQGLAARRQTVNYGRWELIRHAPTHIEMIYHNEYVWIESAQHGSAQGAFDACQVPASIETHLIDRFNGSTIIHW